MVQPIIKKPIISEKSISQGGVSKYTFVVDPKATKPMIARMISQLFKVTVVAVNIIRRPGKTKKFKRITGQRSDHKHAVVTLKSGDRITLFEENKS